MTCEMTVGVNVVDIDRYGTYRKKIAPLLAEIGGKFKCDFELSKVFKCESENPINRVFVISFVSEEAKKLFYKDPRFLEIEKEYVSSCLSHITILAQYRLDD